MKKSIRKPLLIGLSMVLVCVLSVMGTLAYLTATTSKVTNTFAAAGLIDQNNFVLDESKANPSGQTGSYTLDETDRVTSNSYDKVVPGVDVPKDPRISITDLEMEAYLFLKVESSLPATITWTLEGEGTDWTEITNVVGMTDGKLYVRTVNAGSHVFNLIENKTMTVDGAYSGGTNEALSFTAYLTQFSGFNSAAEAWTNTHGAPTP